MSNFLWNLYAIYYDSTVLNFTAYGKLLKRINVLSKINKGETVLNIGCGTGNLEKSFSDIDIKYKWIGIDQSLKMLEIARNKIKNDSRFEFIFWDMNDLSEFISEKKFDTVIMVNSLYIAKDPDNLLQVISNSLSERGKIIISNPKDSSSIVKMLEYEKKERGLLSLIWIILKLFPSLIINVLIRLRAGSGNYHFYSGSELKVKLERLGLIVTTLEDVYADQSLLIIAQK